jgi:hypothetical protein
MHIALPTITEHDIASNCNVLTEEGKHRRFKKIVNLHRAEGELSTRNIDMTTILVGCLPNPTCTAIAYGMPHIIPFSDSRSFHSPIRKAQPIVGIPSRWATLLKRVGHE